MCRNTELVVYVDNKGACDIWRKGFSTSCFYSYSIAKALNDVSRGLNCRVHVTKIARCSDSGSIAADAISKADFKLFRAVMPDYNRAMCNIPVTIQRWLSDPRVDMELGDKILLEMSKSQQVLGYNC